MTERQMEDEDEEEEDISSYWIKLRTRDYWGN